MNYSIRGKMEDRDTLTCLQDSVIICRCACVCACVRACVRVCLSASVRVGNKTLIITTIATSHFHYRHQYVICDVILMTKTQCKRNY